MKAIQKMSWPIAVAAVTFIVRGQTSRGTVTGTVLDASGAAVGGAEVALTSVDTGVTLSSKSNDTGVYRFDAVDPGMYQLQSSHPGFRMFVGTGVRVEANRVTTFDPRLDVGSAETRIEVSAESSEMVIRDSALRGGNFKTREVRDLPLLSV